MSKIFYWNLIWVRKHQLNFFIKLCQVPNDQLLTPLLGRMDCCPQRGQVRVRLSGGRYTERQLRQKV